MDRISIGNRRYLGSKARVIDFLKETVKKECGNIKSVADIFAGIGTIGWAYNDKRTKVIVNDILESNFLSYNAWFDSSDYDNTKIIEIIDKFNSMEVNEENYFSKNFSNTYFSRENCKKIGYIRDNIEELWKTNQINFRERAILITSLIYSMDKIANTVGHYDAYRINGDLSKKLHMQWLDLPNNKINYNNEIYKENANSLVNHIKADLVYIDPPYNSRQYSDAYHLLENVAEWKKEEVFGVAKKIIRSNEIKSKYCTQSATKEMANLIKNIDAKYIVISYNNTGLKGANRSQAKIMDDDIIHMLSERGKVSIFEKELNQFTTGKSHFDNHKERLFICRVGKFNDTKVDNIDIKLEKNEFVKSPLNFTGGKSKILTQIIPLFKQTTTFIDLFGGGFNVGANVMYEKIVYNDTQKELARIIKLLYNNNPHEIIEQVENLVRKYNLSDSTTFGYAHYNCNSDSGLGSYNRDKYIALRNEFNLKNQESSITDIKLLTLIIYAFNNQIRFNSKGEYNMPVGKRDLNNSIKKNIKLFSNVIKNKNIEFVNYDFRSFDYLKYKDPFIYCDPPYSLGIATYNENMAWSKSDDLDLMNFLLDADHAGVPFALSNVIEHKGERNQPLIDWALNNHFTIHYIRANYSNSSYHLINKESSTIEVLITNY